MFTLAIIGSVTVAANSERVAFVNPNVTFIEVETCLTITIESIATRTSVATLRVCAYCMLITMVHASYTLVNIGAAIIC